MKGDFTRDTFDPAHGFTRVLLEQGRVLLDADHNEQTAIFWHYLRTLVTDLVGPHWGPADDCGFEITQEDVSRFKVSEGRYYVNGLLCENLAEFDVELEDSKSYLIYLDVWEQHVTHIEAPHIREVALGGPDTSSRAQTVWQVRVNQLDDSMTSCIEALRALPQPTTAQLQACARQDSKPEDPCAIPPQSRYRGAENQLYRVEIHHPGEAGKATFKWSRDNGSVTFPIIAKPDEVVSLAHLGRDGRFTLTEGDWVEAIDDDYTLEGRYSGLLRVEKVFREEQRVLLSAAPDKVGQHLSRHPYLRRWDQPGQESTGGALLVKEDTWLALEDGVQIKFGGGDYRSGDYWLIPARTATGDVEWPVDADGRPAARAPHGIVHHYAPLAIVNTDGTIREDCRCKQELVCTPV